MHGNVTKKTYRINPLTQPLTSEQVEELIEIFETKKRFYIFAYNRLVKQNLKYNNCKGNYSMNAGKLKHYLANADEYINLIKMLGVDNEN